MKLNARSLLLPLTALALTGCVDRLDNWNDSQKTTENYLETATYRVNAAQLQPSLQAALRPLAERLEDGILRVTITGPAEPRQSLELSVVLQQQLAMPTLVEHHPANQSGYQVALTVTLQPHTCRYQQGPAEVSMNTCLLKRNQFRAMTTTAHWFEGAEYEVTSSALDVGAVQRLYDDKIKHASSQSTTGE
ncbi:hypothetical protein L6J37_13390 [Photobacterium sp. WH77]|uniref:hypothetical protein n=1 Tax=unclassified Photobacterium TaxID=2628852 RepID=UPI001C440655|nr:MULTISPECIES: hypothetical protein [unclassified Photobacterium]MBV7262697.1 hypothetical protein [Photobacterium sp. WH24]MCG2837826.1 hypothetical protein [Photobacterium sp. WH77]MCG2845443.1 hypothetical protein [Photobacterium sp. WH80]